MFWPVAITLVCGFLDIGEPVDRFLATLRDGARSQAASGAIAVVKIDNDALARFPDWQTRRTIDARVTRNLLRLGARRVVFDRAFADPSRSGDDRAFATVIAEHPGQVILGANFETDRQTGQRSPLWPVPALRSVAALGAFSVKVDWMGFTTGVPYAVAIAGRPMRSFASILASKQGGVGELFQPDYAIEARTIPAVGLVDVFDNAPAARIVAGRDVIVGPTADALHDIHRVPRQGAIPGVFVHVIAAETLRRATPFDAGWLPFYLAILALAVRYAGAPRRERAGLAGTGLVVIAAGSLGLDARNIEVEIVPALLLLGSVAVRAAIIARRMVNPATGLPMLDPVVHDTEIWPATIVGIRMRNYADLRATLTDQESRKLLGEVVRRVRVTEAQADLMHLDDTLVWRTALPSEGTLFDHLEGLHAVLSAPIDVGSRTVDLRFAFGIDDQTGSPVSKRIGSVQLSADQAALSGLRWGVHDPRALEDADFRLSLLSRLDHAVACGEIWVAYQAKLDLQRKRISGAEALVRWEHPERGPIRPDEFIPAAEQANRIEALTYYVLDRAVCDATTLLRYEPGFNIAVNLSVRMLALPDLVDRVKAILTRHRLAPRHLTLEVTEGFHLDLASGALDTLKALRDAGIVISIDDYGTKFSNIEYVRHLPAGEIKLDQQFVKSVHTDRNDAIVARSTIELAHRLGLRVVAEGVEAPEALNCLTEMGCDVAQGYLISRPVPLEDITRFLGAIDAIRTRCSYQSLANAG